MLAINTRKRLSPRRWDKIYRQKYENRDDIYGFQRSNQCRFIVQVVKKTDEFELGGFSSYDGRSKTSSKACKQRNRPSSCNQQECSKLKERREKHRLERHSEPQNKNACKAESSPCECKTMVYKSAQTDSITLNDFDCYCNQSNCNDNNEQNAKIEIPFKTGGAQKALDPKEALYADNLKEEILKWFLDIPVFPNLDNNVKVERLKNISDLVHKINDLSTTAHDSDYYENVKKEIELCLGVLPMWYPGAKVEKDTFKKNLGVALLKGIKKLNDKFFFERKESVSVSNKRMEQMKTCDVKSFPFDDTSAVENEIKTWINTEVRNHAGNQAIIDILMNRIMPILKTNINLKSTLESEIIHVLKQLHDNGEKRPKHEMMPLNKIAVDLTNRIINVSNRNNTSKVRFDQFYENNVVMYHNLDDDSKHTSLNNVTNSVEIANIITYTDDSEEDNIKEITDTLIEDINSLINVDGNDSLAKTGNLLENRASKLADELVQKSLSDNLNLKTVNQRLSGTLTVLTSELDFSEFCDRCPLTSTPVKEERKIEPKLSPEERAYVNKVIDVVRAWLDTTDAKFETEEEKGFKETIANDIAMRIKDLGKLTQIDTDMKVPHYQSYLTYIILKAIIKYELLSPPLAYDTPQVADLRERVMDLGMIDMMLPYQGNRQVMSEKKFHSKKHDPGEQPRLTRYQTDALDVLEDNISLWMNDQPSSIYKDKDRYQRNKELHEVASKIQKKLERNKFDEDIKKDLVEWLTKITNLNAKKVDKLAQDLSKRISKLPQNQTLRKQEEKRWKAFHGEDADIEHEQRSEVNIDPDGQLKEYIDKYMEHYHRAENSLVKGAYEIIVLQELLKLGPTLTKEECNTRMQEKINSDKFQLELEYIKEVAEWIKNLPFYSKLGSEHERIELVNSLARNIAEMEEERINYPDRMDHAVMLMTHIGLFFRELPLSGQDKINQQEYERQLVERIVNIRYRPRGCQQGSSQAVTLTQVIEKFVDLHSKDIGDDNLKRGAYAARLIEEVKRIIRETNAENKITNSQFYNQLGDVPLPGNESVKLFSTELLYVQEIVPWLQNFPLIPLRNLEDQVNRITAVSELAQKMIERDRKKLVNPDDNSVDEELDNFIANWINQLNLDPSKEIVVPMLISQLRKRMDKVKKELNEKTPPIPEGKQDVSVRLLDRSKNKPPVCCGSLPKEASCCNASKDKNEDPGELMVKVIEDWCEQLPIGEEDEEATKAAKEKVATDMFQKVGSLNIDPQIADNDLLYKDMLTDEVEAELKDLSGRYDIEDKKDELKNSLVDKVMETKNVIKDMNAGENYKKRLEDTIDASLPNPVHNAPINDPGYELYRNRVAMLWLLENYDYSVDYNTLQYKNKLIEEIDKYCGEIQKRNILPMEKNEIFNEIFSALYTQNPPRECAIIEEVENIKTRCEVDAWFKELPLKKTSDFQELLKRDHIVAVLAKRLYDTENSESPDAEEKMRKEIMKWLSKLPLLPGSDKYITMYVDKLVYWLKATKDVRKCRRELESDDVVKDDQKNKSKDETVTKAQVTKKVNVSPIAGPSGLQPCCKVRRQKAAILLTAALEAWSNLITSEVRANSRDEMRDVIVINVYQLLNNLHTDPNILTDAGLYEHFLNVELEKILLTIPGCCEMQHIRNEFRKRIITDLMAIRPMIIDELDREGYKQNLKHTISSFFEDTIDEPKKDVIVNNFIKLSCHRDDFAEQQPYKNEIDKTLVDVLHKNEENDDAEADVLLSRNQLICEMNKVRPPKESAIIDEVQEIRMKDEIAEFLKECEMPENAEKNENFIHQMKLVLANKLIDIENSGQNCSHDQKMKTEIVKTLNKMGVKVNSGNVEDFVQHLKQTEEERKEVPIRKLPQVILGQSLVMRSPSGGKSSFSNAIDMPLPQMAQKPSSLLPQPSDFVLLPPSPPKSHPPVATCSPNVAPPVNTNVSQLAQNLLPPSRAASIRQSFPNSSTSSHSPPHNFLNRQAQSLAPDFGMERRQALASTVSNQITEGSRETGTRTTVRAQSSTIEPSDFGDCKCKRNNKKKNCKGICKVDKTEYCDECEHDHDCDFMYPYPVPMPGFIYF